MVKTVHMRAIDTSNGETEQRQVQEITGEGASVCRAIIASHIVRRFPHMTWKGAYELVRAEGTEFGDTVAFLDGDYAYVAFVTFD